MKIAPIMEEIGRRPGLQGLLIHTGQHFSPEMSGAFFRDLCLPEPDQHLDVGPGAQTEQTAAVMRALEPSFLWRRPDLVLVVGDVTSTLAAALVAANFHPRAMQSNVPDRLGVQPKSHVLATLYRPSKVDDPDRLRGLTRLLTKLAERLPVVFPIHPRTLSRREAAGVPIRASSSPIPAASRKKPRS